jgi:hypothetical protein
MRRSNLIFCIVNQHERFSVGWVLKALTLRWKIEIRRIQGFPNSCFERRQNVGHRIPKRNRIDAVILMP